MRTQHFYLQSVKEKPEIFFQVKRQPSSFFWDQEPLTLHCVQWVHEINWHPRRPHETASNCNQPLELLSQEASGLHGSNRSARYVWIMYSHPSTCDRISSMVYSLFIWGHMSIDHLLFVQHSIYLRSFMPQMLTYFFKQHVVFYYATPNTSNHVWWIQEKNRHLLSIWCHISLILKNIKKKKSSFWFKNCYFPFPYLAFHFFPPIFFFRVFSDTLLIILIISGNSPRFTFHLFFWLLCFLILVRADFLAPF